MIYFHNSIVFTDAHVALLHQLIINVEDTI